MNRGAAFEAAVAVVLGALLVLFGSSVSDLEDPAPDLRASSFVSDRPGLRALYLILNRSGAQPERLLEPPAALARTDATLLIAVPSEPLVPSHVEAILDWLERGGRLVLLTAGRGVGLESFSSSRLVERLGIESRTALVGGRSPRVAADSGLDAAARIEWPASSVLLPNTDGADPRARPLVPLVTTPKGALAVRVPFGAPPGEDGEGAEPRGEAIVVSDVRLFDNDYLRRADNVIVAVGLLTSRESDGARVIFDEYHHGFRREGSPSVALSTALIGLITGTWPGRAVLLLGLAWLVYALGRTVRLGSPLPEPAAGRRALSEHADALGRLLEGARARREALSVLTAGVRRAVGQRAGLSPRLSAAEFHRRLSLSPAPGAAELAIALDHAERAAPTKDVQLARLAANLAATRRRYLHGGS